MGDHRISVAYNLCHPPADPDAIRPLIERLRQRAIDLGFLRVGDLVFLQGDDEIISHEYGERFAANDLPITPIHPIKVCYFVAALCDSEVPVEIGLCRYPVQIEVDGLVIPFGVPDWIWTGATRTSDLKTFSLLLHHAAEIGVWASTSFAATTVTYSRRRRSGEDRAEQEDEIYDDC